MQGTLPFLLFLFFSETILGDASLFSRPSSSLPNRWTMRHISPTTATSVRRSRRRTLLVQQTSSSSCLMLLSTLPPLEESMRMYDPAPPLSSGTATKSSLIERKGKTSRSELTTRVYGAVCGGCVRPRRVPRSRAMRRRLWNGSWGHRTCS